MTFSVDSLTSLSSIKPGATIHVIGVCGVAMAQIALQLVKMGYTVRGSDKEFFEPMSSLLQGSNIDCRVGYKSENITSNLDLVVIGNSVTSDNPEVLACQQLQLPYTIFPKLLNELVIAGKHSIVVSGTHGKTTSSAMLAFVLEAQACNPSYSVGGKSSQLSSGLKVGPGSISVVEDDEYDSSFFAKFAKFHFYKPDTLIITSIEFDHADIYPNLEAIKAEFFKLLQNMTSSGTVIACYDDGGVRDFIARIVDLKPKLLTYGEDPGSDVKISFIKNSAGTLAAGFTSKTGYNCEVSLSIPGRYNLKNAVASLLAIESAGMLPSAQIINAFKEFKGVNRRQQVWLNSPFTLIEDFAHHPTAVSQTLAGIKEWLPGRRIIAIFEPRSNTSRKKIFQNDYISSLMQADLVIMKETQARLLDSASDLFNVNEVCQQIAKNGVEAHSLKEVEEIQEFVQKNVKKDDVIIVMSNGSFGGLIDKLAQSLSAITYLEDLDRKSL